MKISRKYWQAVIQLVSVLATLVLIYHYSDEQLKSDWSNHTRDFSKFYTSFSGSLLHSNLDHLTGNLISIAGLSIIFILLFPSDWLLFFLVQWVMSSVILFFLGQQGEHHLGASVWGYSFVGFLLAFSLLHPNKRMLSILFLTLSIYGGIIWGLIPTIPEISYAGHFSGLVTGVLIALLGKSYWDSKLPRVAMPNWWHEESDDYVNPYDNL